MKNKAAQALARLRAKSLTPERRREIARMGGKAKWEKARAKALEKESSQ